MTKDITELLSKLVSTGYNYDFEKIKKAYEFASKAHDGQKRKSGEDYIVHPLSVAEIVASLELDTDSICAALLHDTVEDCSDVNIDIIKKQFGQNVAELVDGVTKLVNIPFFNKEEQHAENLRKMFLAMSKDIRVIFIKLCDRLHNMRTLSSHEESKQRTIALETMHVYAPLAHRLGMQKIKQELEMLALQYLDPIGYNEIKNDIDKKYGINKDFLKKAQERICQKLNEQNIKFGIEGRVKSIYSMYKKMYNHNKSFDEIYDFYAMRILVDTELECYTALGIIHETFNSMPGRFKDYISTPKPNMYRSLHTTVIGRDGIPFEVQIRTWEMHAVAEYGLAAHWKYKTGVSGSQETIDSKLAWIRTLLETERESMDPDELLSPLKFDVFEDEIFVFTPKGDVINLPSGANGIDFAYAIHSAVGNKLIGVKANGMIIPIDAPLKTGQIVEILTSTASKGPNRDWLKLVKTGEAKNKIRQWFKKEKRSENILIGKSEVDKEFDKLNRCADEKQKEEILSIVAQRHGMASLDDLYNFIGYGGITVAKILPRIKHELDKLSASQQPQETTIKTVSPQQESHAAKSGGKGVIIQNIDNCQVKYAKCCNPLPGDPIIGFITKGFGISIHKYNCKNAVAGLSDPKDKDRWVNASWAQKALEDQSARYEAALNIQAKNSLRIFADVSGALADMRIETLSVNSRNTGEGICHISLVIRTKNRGHFDSIVSRLRQLEDVIYVSGSNG
ncbi:MAG: bifunctional (p)ppGpp synthetase/guanosine-3',5'-bis(diphosphate) 3'-pyrophosphohydrolase [Ruminococcaceae bacterium]|nr:bifunctional (p)ppGpp synthetase/guanosine-3',5'-bis(diphosphate) 3'-pyrophosphohydrolase [Oscillospiraceae bacterium]